MPDDLVARCRAAWRRLDGRQMSVVHGDLNPGNCLIREDGRNVLIDWDECRHDYTVFDLAQVTDPSSHLAPAVNAWEIACSWHLEPERAKRLAEQF